ncbi:hypothetical protein OEG84_02705 [Hoeflea sp. G2-23]|uniref:Uncharacterized protein n=1 Tax=Hoeflea algicola TaxID=2983763 RepID=A0ABT3Z4M4_9HYPH|nr:hypothetical protein [Hoeflea algicola]MCY0146654.1 hypothetical protein [Hoeflea algicola]
MSELRLSYPACTLAEKSNFTPQDVQLIENRVFARGLDGPDAVATLLALEHCRAEKCVEWDEFFIRTLTDHVVNHLAPAGTMTRAKADWLRRALARGGLIASRNEIEALVRIMEMAGTQSHHLAAFALSQVWHAVVEGEGPLASRRKGLWAVLGMEQLTYINRVLAALGSAQPFSVADAEALFDPALDLTPGGQKSAWREFIARVAGPGAVAA